MTSASVGAAQSSGGTIPPFPLTNLKTDLVLPASVEPVADAEKLLGLYHEIAANTPGVFVLGYVTPARTKDAAKPKWFAQKFKIGDSKTMAAEARTRGRHSNVYFGPALMRSDLPAGSRGKEADIVAVASVVIEEDADTGKMVTLPAGVAPSFVVRTSSKPKINSHFHFVLDEPLAPKEAKELAELAYRKCGGDHGGKDIDHVWRVPETLNFPTLEKVARGRPETPQPVGLVKGTGKPISVEALRAALEAMPDLHPETKASGAADRSSGGGAEWSSVGSKDRDAILKSAPFPTAQRNQQGRTGPLDALLRRDDGFVRCRTDR